MSPGFIRKVLVRLELVVQHIVDGLRGCVNTFMCQFDRVVKVPS